MNKMFAVGVVAVLALTVLAVFGDVDNEFTMQFKGTCRNQGTQCEAKGNSQTISMTVDPSDAIDFSVKTVIGSYADIRSVVTYNKDTNMYSEYGNVTFGTHLTRSHTLYFNTNGNTGRKEYVNKEGGEYVYSMSAVVDGGTGAFDGARGMMSVAGYGIDADFSSFTQYVSIVSNVDL
eukprot:m.12037 g.12037  ORF g.12037 m.12037 type:complete len:177 (-) comp7107_c0_seq1:142-672(-)